MLIAGVDRLRFPTQEKPRGPLRIDWRHPLAQALCVCVVHSDMADGVDIDLVRGGNPGAIDGPVDTYLGTGTRYNIADGVGYNLPYKSALSTSDGAGGGDLTLAIQFCLNAAADWQYIVKQTNPALTAYFSIVSNPTGSGGNLIYATPAGYQVISFTANLGQVYAVAFTRRSGTDYFYIDGADTGVTQADIATVWDSTSDFGWGDVDNGAANASVDFTALQTAAWNRALDPSEILVWSQDPYRFLLPAESEMAVLFTSGTPPGSSVTFRRTRSHLGTKVNSRQVA